VVELRICVVLLEVVARSGVLRWRWSTVSFLWMVTTMEEVVLVGVVAVDLNLNVLLHLQRKMVVQSINVNGDGGGGGGRQR
jgi:hypothetical protein